MAFLRADSSKTFASRAWSTEELAEGLKHVLTDGRLELPDDLAQLKGPKQLSMLDSIGTNLEFIEILGVDVF